MFCGKCGAQIPDGGAFCSACGAPAARKVDPKPFLAAAPVTGESIPSTPQSTGTPEISPKESSIEPIVSKPPKSKVAGCVGAVVIIGVLALCIVWGSSYFSKRSSSESASSGMTLVDLQASAKDDADFIIKRFGPPDLDKDNLNKHLVLAERYLIYRNENVSYSFVGKGDLNGEPPGWKLVLVRNAGDTKSSVSLSPMVVMNRMKNRDHTR